MIKIKRVLIANFESSSSEAEAIRQTLECLGFMVFKINIARPNNFIEILSDKIEFNFDYLIFTCHGKNNEIIMPILDKGVFEKGEPRKNFGYEEIQKYLKLKNKIIINTGCTTGNDKFLKVFSENNTYIAPKNYIEGNSILPFITILFYEISKNENLKQAFEKSKNIDKETLNFTFIEKEQD